MSYKFLKIYKFHSYVCNGSYYQERIIQNDALKTSS